MHALPYLHTSNARANPSTLCVAQVLAADYLYTHDGLRLDTTIILTLTPTQVLAADCLYGPQLEIHTALMASLSTPTCP